MSFAGDIVVQPAAPVVGSQLDEIYRQMLEVSATATDAALPGAIVSGVERGRLRVFERLEYSDFAGN